MRMKELQDAYCKGIIDKKLYWTIMRENYTHVLPQLQEILKNHEECAGISITAEGVILEKKTGVKLLFDFSQAMCRAEIDLVNPVDPEHFDMLMINRLIDENGCKVALDIGANNGMFSLEIINEHPDMELHLFEPVPTTFENLLKTLSINNADTDRLHPNCLGMSDKKGTFDFYLPGESEAASLRPVTDEFYCKRADEFGKYTGSLELEKVKCQVSTVDDYVTEKSLDRIDLIKIDVEGNEKFVLEGAEKTLGKFHPIVYSELLRKHAAKFGYHPNDVIAFMAEHGYRCFTVRGEALEEVPIIDEETAETNFVFIYSKENQPE